MVGISSSGGESPTPSSSALGEPGAGGLDDVQAKAEELKQYFKLLASLDPIERHRAVATGSLIDAMIETNQALADILNRGGGQPPSPGAVGIEG